MRVLVLTTALRATPDVQLLLHLASALSRRGEVVGVGCVHGSAVETLLTTEWPRLSMRTFGRVDSSRHASGVRDVVRALRPDVVLVRSESDAALAAAAVGAQGGVVRLLAPDERGSADDADGTGWTFGRSRGRIIEWGRRTLALAWPDSLPATTLAGVTLSPELLVLPPSPLPAVDDRVPYDPHTATALRTAAHLRRRHPELRVTLVGDPGALQGARVHAAALDLTPVLAMRPLHALLTLQLANATALWVADAGDAGAIGALAAMHQGVPVVLSGDTVASTLVASGITGFVDQSPTGQGALPAPPISLVMELARLLGDPTMRRAMGDAARSKAHREHNWDAFVDEAIVHLAKAGGVPATPRNESASLPGGTPREGAAHTMGDRA